MHREGVRRDSIANLKVNFHVCKRFFLFFLPLAPKLTKPTVAHVKTMLPVRFLHKHLKIIIKLITIFATFMAKCCAAMMHASGYAARHSEI